MLKASSALYKVVGIKRNVQLKKACHCAGTAEKEHSTICKMANGKSSLQTMSKQILEPSVVLSCQLLSNNPTCVSMEDGH